MLRAFFWDNPRQTSASISPLMGHGRRAVKYTPDEHRLTSPHQDSPVRQYCQRKVKRPTRFLQNVVAFDKYLDDRKPEEENGEGR